MIAKRSWRNFDYLLFGTLLILAVLGVVMIYSATINTYGIEDPVQRQIIFVGVGLVVLLATASVDYRLLELLQHPFGFFTPLFLALGSIGLVVVWRATQLPAVEGTLSLGVFLPYLPAILVGVALVLAVYALDMVWIEKVDLPMTRFVLAAVVVVLFGVTALVFVRLGAARQTALMPYFLVVWLALLYLLDCLTLRFTDTLRNSLYVFALGLLGVIFVAGQVAGGSQRWLGQGTVQPSELAKILVIVVLAKFLADREERMGQFSTVLTSMLVVAVPMFLIYLQPDLGTALTLGAIWVAMMWMAGMRFLHLLLLALAGVAALPLVWLNLEDYMKQRIMLFVNPAGDPDSYFNVHQSLVSIGSGGWTGKGLTEGTQSQLHFLRVRHTDFIFAVTAEELGLLGALVLMGLLVFLLWRTLRVAERSRDMLGRLIAAGVAAVILFQSVVNIGMNLGLMPVTGIPLPFVSYGGSSLLTLMLAIGLVESVAMRRRKLEFD
jgi:rod shape determining protein RodA